MLKLRLTSLWLKVLIKISFYVDMFLDQFTLLGNIFGLIIYISVSMALYSPLVFGTVWQKNKGISEEDIRNSGLSWVLSLVSGFIGIKALYVMSDLVNISSPLQGAGVGLLMAVLTSAISFNHVIYNKKVGFKNRQTVWLIDSLNILIVFVLSGAVFGLLM